jgi:hypothetical protein
MDRRTTFVLWVSLEAAPDPPGSGVVLAGRVEQVDTGRQLRFRSTEQLVGFLEECLNVREQV